MSLIADIAGETIAKPITALGDVASKFITTDKDRMQYDKDMAAMQTRIDEIEASNNTTLTSWRAALGWVCAGCVALYYVPQFIIGDYIWVRESVISGHAVPFPVDPESLFNLVCLLLGFGAYRSFEKVFKR